MSLFKRTCERHGHRFEARYDYAQAPCFEQQGGTSAGFIATMEAARARTYVHDICTRCGQIRTPAKP